MILQLPGFLNFTEFQGLVYQSLGVLAKSLEALADFLALLGLGNHLALHDVHGDTLGPHSLSQLSVFLLGLADLGRFKLVHLGVELLALWQVDINIHQVHVVLFVGDSLQFHLLVLFGLEQVLQLLILGLQPFDFRVLIV